MKTILFDASLCNGCYGCQMACKDEHCGNDWSPIAAEQPLTGQFWYLIAILILTKKFMAILKDYDGKRILWGKDIFYKYDKEI